MRCLVTGAYGFIGSAVVAALRREGVDVVGAGRDLELARLIHPDIEWTAFLSMLMIFWLMIAKPV